MRHNKKNFLLLVSVLAAMILLAGITNYVRFNSFTEFGYGYFSTLATHDGWVGLLGLLISPGAGLIFYFPLAVLLPLGAKYVYKDNRALFFLCAYIIVINWIYVGTLSFGAEPISWSGGVAWGPRYLIPVLPFIMVILGSIIRHANKKRPILRITVIALCIAGFYVNLSGVLIWFQYGLMYGWQYEGLAAYPNSLDIITWYPQYSPIVLHTKALLINYVSTVDPTQYASTSWYWAGYGNAPCSVDLYIYCNIGIAAVLVIVFFLVLLLIFISARVGFLSNHLFRPAPFSAILARNLRKPKFKANTPRRLSE